MDHVTLHLEPPRREFVTVAAPLDAAGTLSSEFGSAAVFRFSRIRGRDGTVIANETVANPHTDVERQKGLLVAEWLVRQGADVLLTRQTPRKGPAYLLRERAVQIRLAHTGDVAAELARLSAAPPLPSPRLSRPPNPTTARPPEGDRRARRNDERGGEASALPPPLVL